MKKIHTREKRKYGLNTHTSHYLFFHPKAKPHRPKTFASEENAKKWAKENGLTEGKYTLKTVKKNKRFQVVPVTE